MSRTRLSPEARREQLLDLGVRMLATRSLEELSIDALAEEAGISRGLLYHYFRTKADFHEAVVERAAADVVRLTAPSDDPDPLVRLLSSVRAYVEYVESNQAGYTSLVQRASGGNDRLREIYETTRAALTDRIFEAASPEDLAALGLVDDAATRLMVRGWGALVEDVVLAWVRQPGPITKDELISLVTNALVGLLPRPAQHEAGTAVRSRPRESNDGSRGGSGEDADTTRADEQPDDDQHDAPQNLGSDDGQHAGDDEHDCEDPQK